jgi:phage terminase large subunit GpA-like protein
MNWLIDRPASFWAEGQNEPMSLNPEGDALSLVPAQLTKRLTGVPRGVVPTGCGRLTAGVDVSEFVIWWVVSAWDEKFGGSVVDYGCWPPQGRTYFRQEEAAPSLRTRFPDQPVEAAVYHAIKATLAEVMGRTFPTEEGSDGMQVERCLVDSSDQTRTVYDAIRASEHKAAVWPSKGFGANASRTPVSEWPEKPGDKRRGKDWVYGPTAGAAPRLLLKFGANEWKSFLADRFRTPEAAPAALRLFGDDEFVHQMFADHCAAEVPDRQRSETTGRVATVWTQRPGRQNHLFDCTVLSAVAASTAGVRWSAGTVAGDTKAARRPRQWVDIDDLNKAAGPGVT